MTVQVEEERKDRPSPFLMLLPVEQAGLLELTGLAAPGVWAAYLVSQRRLLSGGLLLLVWLAAMGAPGIWAHRPRYVRLWITGLLVAAVLIASALAFVSVAQV